MSTLNGVLIMLAIVAVVCLWAAIVLGWWDWRKGREPMTFTVDEVVRFSRWKMERELARRESVPCLRCGEYGPEGFECFGCFEAEVRETWAPKAREWKRTILCDTCGNVLKGPRPKGGLLCDCVQPIARIPGLRA